jgi:CubicO group peptidase (beta-lactamase class C family)
MRDFVPDLSDFSGVLSVRRGDEVLGEWCTGYADRTCRSPNAPDTRFGLASGTKTFTAATVLSLVDEGRLTLATTARDILGEDLPLIAADVTVDHLLTHTSGIGDYLDEEIDDLAPLSRPAQEIASTPDYLPMLAGFPTKFRAGERFSYCNGGYVVLAVIVERVTGRAFAEEVARRVFAPAGMAASGFPRSDLLPPGTATGYLDDGRTNVFELPVMGSGDGGAHADAGDLHRFWRALVGGGILSERGLMRLTEAVTPDADDGRGYGRGIWLADGELILSGSDHGVTAMSRHDPATGITVTALANIGTRVLARTAAAMAAARAA